VKPVVVKPATPAVVVKPVVTRPVVVTPAAPTVIARPAVVTSPAAVVVDTSRLVAKYVCKGTNADGSPCAGTATITRGADGLLHIRYDFDRLHDVGTIEVAGGRAVAQFEGARVKSRTGEAEYELMSDGTLVGRWRYGTNAWTASRLTPVR
jgi:hypothetical protein